MPKFLIPVFIIFLLIACRKTSTSSFEKSFPGFYKVTKITSATSVDLNNDGIKSTNVYAEIVDPFTTIRGEHISFYDFQARQNYMQVRPMPGQVNNGKLIAFNFPHQIIDYLSNNTPFLVEYNNDFLHYAYEITDDKITLTSFANPEYMNQIGEINRLVVKEAGALEVMFKKKIFDFFDKSWKEISISVEYSKVP
jgi:hypothetical protein